MGSTGAASLTGHSWHQSALHFAEIITMNLNGPKITEQKPSIRIFFFFLKNNKQTFTFTSYLVALHETWCVKDFPFLKYNLIYLSPLGQFCSILTALLTVWSCIELTGQKTFPSFSLYWLLQSAVVSCTGRCKRISFRGWWKGGNPFTLLPFYHFTSFHHGVEISFILASGLMRDIFHWPPSWLVSSVMYDLLNSVH